VRWSRAVLHDSFFLVELKSVVLPELGLPARATV